MDERILKYFSHQLNETQESELLNEASRDQQLWQEMKDMLNIQSLLTLLPEMKGEKSSALSLEDFRRFVRTQHLRKLSLRIISYAAAMAFGMVMTWFVYSRQIANKYRPVAQTITVPTGQRAHITLPDGSSVWVNSGSTLRYPSVFQDTRLVELSGEALFDVAKDKEKPFVVRTDSLEVKALGTHFNVQAYTGESTTVSLIKGKVEVSMLGQNESGALLNPGESARLRGGQISISDIDQDPRLWTEGIYSFSNMKLKDLTKKLQLYYDVKIVIQRPALADIVFSGKFRQRDGVMEILQLASKVHPFRMRRDMDKNTIIVY